jgi:hypothetical protein
VHLEPAYTENPAIDVYRNISALPRILFVQQAEVVADHGAAWQAIHAPTFAPSHTVILERRQAQQAGQHSQTNQGNGETDLSLVHYGLNDLTINVRAPVDGYVVFSDVYYPGWQATVDGTPVALLRANYIFRAVPVSAGEHQVRMWFAPRTWHVGLIVSGLTWLGLLVWTAVALRKRQGPSR